MPLGYYWAPWRPRIVRDIVFICVVLHNMLRTHQNRAGRSPTAANDVAVLQNEQVVYVPNDNYSNFLTGSVQVRWVMFATGLFAFSSTVSVDGLSGGGVLILSQNRTAWTRQL